MYKQFYDVDIVCFFAVRLLMFRFVFCISRILTRNAITSWHAKMKRLLEWNLIIINIPIFVCFRFIREDSVIVQTITEF